MSTREAHLAPDAPDHPHEPVPVRGDDAGDRHEVDHLTDAGLGHEPGDEDRGVREVQLLAGDGLHGGPDPEVPPSLVVEQRPEDARRVEPWCAEPVDGAVGGDERRGLEVADEAVVGDERVVSHDHEDASGQPATHHAERMSAVIRRG